jgi:hypothetical protein
MSGVAQVEGAVIGYQQKRGLPDLCLPGNARRHADCHLQSREVGGLYFLSHLMEEANRDQDQQTIPGPDGG